MISSNQIKSARAFLKISAAELSEISGVDHRTIQRFEAADGIPASRSGNLEKVRAALEAQGIRFLGDPILSPGVQLIRPK